MKSYMVLVSCEDYIEVEAETEAEAESQAVEIFNRDTVKDCDATIIHVSNPEE